MKRFFGLAELAVSTLQPNVVKGSLRAARFVVQLAVLSEALREKLEDEEDETLRAKEESM